MTEEELDRLVKHLGAPRALHTTKILRELMPTLLYSRAGNKTLAFISALEAAAERAKCSEPPAAAE